MDLKRVPEGCPSGGTVIEIAKLILAAAPVAHILAECNRQAGVAKDRPIPTHFNKVLPIASEPLVHRFNGITYTCVVSTDN